MLGRVGKALRIISEDDKEKIALVFDLPTLIQDFNLSNLKLLKKALLDIGSIRAGKLITDKQLTEKESEIIKAQGFNEEIVGSEVDIHVTLEVLEFLNSDTFDIIGIGTTDSNLFPIFSRIKKEKKLLIISWKKDITPAMESIADYILYLDYL
ncbi:MAG: hypothetical protein FK730_06990 [Asgard group archaeon]|nr:hypothetical protein [Asgard group archaeon]